MAKKKINFMCTAFRDGFQSVYGARVFTKDFMPAVEAAREAGITHFEAGGGARFQSLYFYCQEDAFEMMDKWRATVGPDVNLQTLARGVNVVGLSSQPSDIIELHAKLFKKHGITLVDFKMEFGRTSDGQIVLADEISPDTCRFWDSETNEKLDKDRFRRDLGKVREAYEEILHRLTK